MLAFLKEVFDTIITGMVALLTAIQIIPPVTETPPAPVAKVITSLKTTIESVDQLPKSAGDKKTQSETLETLVKKETLPTLDEIRTNLLKSQVLDNSPITPPLSFKEINNNARGAIVNIFCTVKTGGFFKPISGTGIMITKDGLLLTAAHVGQYFLIKDYSEPNFIDCAIRGDNPAKPLYRAELVYISTHWIENNANNISKDDPEATGEHDFAFLRIIETVDRQIVMPVRFPFLPIDISEGLLVKGRAVLIAGYPSGLIGGIATTFSLFSSSAISEIRKSYQFSDNQIDLVSLGGSILAQKGSSGGAVVGENGNLEAMIVVSTLEGDTDNRDLRAISMGHINRGLKAETGKDLLILATPGRKESAELFNYFDLNEKDRLTDLLVKAIERR